MREEKAPCHCNEGKITYLNDGRVEDCDSCKGKGYHLKLLPEDADECLRLGGHCYETSPMVGASNPPTYWRYCKHCGKKQTGRPQPSIDWNDTNAS